jgi:hypothetical protein
MILSLSIYSTLLESGSPLLTAATVALLLACIAAAWGVSARAGEARRRLVAVGAAVFAGAVVAAVIVGRFPGWDDMEHLHAAWLVAHGQLPYRDFVETHTPLMYLVLAPVVRLVPRGAAICDFARITATLISLGTLWMLFSLARSLRGSQAIAWPMMLLLWAGAIVPQELYELRPDLLATACSVAAFALMARSRRAAALLGAGILLGFAVQFTPKHIPLIVVFPLVLLLERNSFAAFAKSAGAYALGFLVALLPMGLWLHANGLVGEMLHWAFRFNVAQEGDPDRWFPIMSLLLLLSWGVQLWRRGWAALSGAERLTAAGLVTGGLIFLAQPIHSTPYGMQMFALLAVVACATAATGVVGWLFAKDLWPLAAILLGIYVAPTALAVRWLCHGDYFAGRNEIGALAKIAGDEPVVGVPPRHPIFAPNATRLSLTWQWYTWMEKDDLRAQLRGIADQIIATRPSLIMMGDTLNPMESPQPDNNYFVGNLERTGNITPAEAQRLGQFISGNYSLVEVFRHYYWVRKDRPLPAGCRAVTPPLPN